MIVWIDDEVISFAIHSAVRLAITEVEFDEREFTVHGSEGRIVRVTKGLDGARLPNGAVVVVLNLMRDAFGENDDSDGRFEIVVFDMHPYLVTDLGFKILIADATKV